MQPVNPAPADASAETADSEAADGRADELDHLVDHLIETQGGHAAAVAEGIAASAEASGNARQRSLWLRVCEAIARRG